jgi:cyclase
MPLNLTGVIGSDGKTPVYDPNARWRIWELGEIVLNMMNQDGVRQGYDLTQLKLIRDLCKVPLIASGGAGEMVHFRDAFQIADVDGALAASVFHKGIIPIPELKAYLRNEGVQIRD